MASHMLQMLDWKERVWTVGRRAGGSSLTKGMGRGKLTGYERRAGRRLASARREAVSTEKKM